jgi:hypothetical protein
MIFVMVKCCVLFEVRTEFKYYLEELRIQRVKNRNTMAHPNLNLSLTTFRLLNNLLPVFNIKIGGLKLDRRVSSKSLTI